MQAVKRKINQPQLTAYPKIVKCARDKAAAAGCTGVRLLHIINAASIVKCRRAACGAVSEQPLNEVTSICQRSACLDRKSNKRGDRKSAAIQTAAGYRWSGSQQRLPVFARLAHQQIQPAHPAVLHHSMSRVTIDPVDLAGRTRRAQLAVLQMHPAPAPY